MPSSGYYETYWTSEGYNPHGGLLPQVQRLYERHIRPTDDCLEVGSGSGRANGPWLNAHACSYTGVDIFANALRQARELGLEVTKIEDAGTLPFGDGTFDVTI